MNMACNTTLEKKLGEVCEQMQHILSQMKAVRTKIDRATTSTNHICNPSLKLQLQVLEEVYKMYYLYAERTTHQMLLQELKQTYLDV